MKLYKKLVLALGVTLIVVMPLLGVLPIAQTHASAASLPTYHYSDGKYTSVLGIDSSGKTVETLTKSSTTSKSYSSKASNPNQYHIITVTYIGAPSGDLKSYKVVNGTLVTAGDTTVQIGPPVSISGTTKATGIWIDHSNIKATIDGKSEIFTDGQIDTDYTFTNSDNSCPNADTIKTNSNPNNTASLTYYRPSTTPGDSNCNTLGDKIKLSDPNNAYNNYLNWTDGGTITASDGKSAVFVASDTGKQFLIQSGNSFSPGQDCQSYIVPSSSKTTGQLTLQYSPGHPLGNFKGWPAAFNNAQFSPTSSGGCMAAKPFTIKIGDVSNSKLAAGTSVDDTSDGIDLKCSGFSINPATFISQILTLKWIMCPLINGFQAAAAAMDNGISYMLCINEQNVFGFGTSSCDSSVFSSSSASNAYKNAWNVFRLMALGLLALAALVMILSQTSGMEIVDAYTVRKVLPRLLVAAIGITLSWQLMDFFVGLSNILGTGLRGLIYAPFVQAGLDKTVLGGGATAIGSITALGGLAVLGPLGILSLVATGLLAIFIAFFVMVLRNMLIIILLISAPVAIAAYILPNTEKYWKIWWEWFSKALMVFPIITVIIAVGHVFSAIASSQGQGNGPVAVVTQAAAFIAYFAPYFLLPATFRFAGGALATIGGFANDRSRGAFDRLKGYRKNKAASNYARMQQGNLFRGGTERNLRGMINRGFQRGTNASLENIGANPANWRSRMRSTLGNQEFDHAMEGMEKDAAFRAIAPDDDMLTAGRQGGEAQVRAYLAGKGRKGDHLNDSVAAVMQAKRSMGDKAFNIASAVATAGTKTGYAGEYDDEGNLVGRSATEQMMTAINEASGGDKALAARMYGTSRGVAGRAGRLDLANPSFGTAVGETFNTIDAAVGAGGGAAIDDKMNVDTFLNTDAVTLGRADSRAVRNIMNSVGRRVNTLQGRRDAGETLSANEQSELGRLSQGMQNMADQGFYYAPQRVQSVQRAMDRTAKTRGKVDLEADRVIELGQHEVVSPQTGQRVRTNEVAEGAIEQRNNRSSNISRDVNDPRLQQPDQSGPDPRDDGGYM